MSCYGPGTEHVQASADTLWAAAARTGTSCGSHLPDRRDCTGVVSQRHRVTCPATRNWLSWTTCSGCGVRSSSTVSSSRWTLRRAVASVALRPRSDRQRNPARGRPKNTFGSLLLVVPDSNGDLHFVGHVGAGSPRPAPRLGPPPRTERGQPPPPGQETRPSPPRTVNRVDRDT